MSYCAYSHYSSMLKRTGTDWLVAVYEVYFDDSGTDAQSEMAIAACYVSTKRGWDMFVNEWDIVRRQEGFDVFHMAEFRAPREQGHRPWCEWDDAKKDRVYERLATIINQNKRIGTAAALPKAVYDMVPDRIREHYGKNHYTFAVRMCLVKVAEWREKSLISLPMQYVFDWEERGTPKHIEISEMLNNVHERLKSIFGLDGGGYSFQRRAHFKPLQAADILAWQMNKHMRKILPLGQDTHEVLHWGFRILREDQEMELGFFSETFMQAWVKRIEEHEATHGVIC